MVQANQRSGAPLRDDRLDISSSGKSRSDPARMRVRAGQRGRGRQSLDVARDLKRSPTIDENVRDPTPSSSQSGLDRNLSFSTAYLSCHRSAHQGKVQRCTDLTDWSECKGSGVKVTACRVQKACLPTIESLVSALANSNEYMANQGAFGQSMPNASTAFSTPEEMAAYSAGAQSSAASL